MNNWISIPRGDAGPMDAYLALPPSGKGPGIVMLQEIFGVNAAMRAKANDLAQAGYTVLVPDLFWRLERRVDLGYGDANRQKGFGLFGRFDLQAGVADTVAAAEWLARAPQCSGRIAFVGFCLGGKVAALAGARHREASAVVSFYGVKLEENVAELKGMKAPFQLHVGDQDAHVPMTTVETLRGALAEKPQDELHVYPRAKHGFFNRLRTDVFDRPAADLAKRRMLDLLARTMR